MFRQLKRNGFSGILLPVLLASTVACGLVACGPPAGPGSPDIPTLTSSAPPTSDAPPPDPTVRPEPGPPVPDIPVPATAPVVRWIPIGPIGPNDPQEGRMYLFAQGRDCEQLRDGVDGTALKDVWRAAGAVCYALRDDTPQLWQDASSALAAVAAPAGDRCLELAVLGVLRSAVESHNANPTAPVSVETGTGEACPRRLTGLTVVDENFEPVPGLSRPSGPRAGGTWVRLDGYYVRAEVLIDGVAANVAGVETRNKGDYSPVYFKTPPAGDKSSITVSMTDTLDAPGEVQFFYDDDGGTGQVTSDPASSEPASSDPAEPDPASPDPASPDPAESTAGTGAP